MKTCKLAATFSDMHTPAFRCDGVNSKVKSCFAGSADEQPDVAIKRIIAFPKYCTMISLSVNTLSLATWLEVVSGSSEARARLATVTNILIEVNLLVRSLFHHLLVLQSHCIGLLAAFTCIEFSQCDSIEASLGLQTAK